MWKCCAGLKNKFLISKTLTANLQYKVVLLYRGFSVIFSRRVVPGEVAAPLRRDGTTQTRQWNCSPPTPRGRQEEDSIARGTHFPLRIQRTRLPSICHQGHRGPPRRRLPPHRIEPEGKARPAGLSQGWVPPFPPRCSGYEAWFKAWVWRSFWGRTCFWGCAPGDAECVASLPQGYGRYLELRWEHRQAVSLISYLLLLLLNI